jgi:hypothetical protein
MLNQYGAIKMAGKHIFTTPSPEKSGCYPMVEGLEKIMSSGLLERKRFYPLSNFVDLHRKIY